jgi:hypothetical protein
MSERDIGVPGAVAEALRQLSSRLPPERLDRVWIFPPLANGRNESGVVAAGCFAGDDRRVLVTLSYRAEETGRGVTFRVRVREEGEAPRNLLPRVMEGAVARSGIGLGAPRSTILNGDARALEVLIEEWTPQAVAEGVGAPQVEPNRFVAPEEVLG